MHTIKEKYFVIPTEAELSGDEFQWDMDLEQDMFEPNIPSDYTQMVF